MWLCDELDPTVCEAWRTDNEEATAAFDKDAATDVDDTDAMDEDEMAAEVDMATATKEAFVCAMFSSHPLLTIGRYAHGGNTVPEGTPGGYCSCPIVLPEHPPLQVAQS